MRYLINDITYLCGESYEDPEFDKEINTGNYLYLVNDDDDVLRPKYDVKYCVLYVAYDGSQCVFYGTMKELFKECEVDFREAVFRISDVKKGALS